MEFPIIDNTAEYVEFMKKNFPQKKIGKMPKSEKDLDLTVRIEMENSAPHLLQRIINPKPAETLHRCIRPIQQKHALGGGYPCL